MPIDRQFRPVSIVLDNDNRLEPDGIAGQPVVLGFEVTPNVIDEFGD